MVVAGTYRNNQRMLLETSEYTNTYKTNYFFFKDMDYVELGDFKASDLTLPEGEKTNGYKSLTQTSKVVDQTFLKYQLDTIDQIMADKYYNDWPAVINEITSNYVGMAKITTQFGQTERQRKEFLVDSVQFMGETQDELNKQKSIYEGLNNGQSRQITLSGLQMMGSGYVYANLNAMEKVVSESALPYINSNFLKTASKIDKEDAPALKIINNDHVYTAFSIPKDQTVTGEEEALKNKEEYMGTRGPEKNAEYYKFLVKRVDQLIYYPTVSFESGGNNYKGYLVDVTDDGDNKIMIMLIKDYVNVFANEIMINTNVNIEQFECYQIPQSAIIKKDGATFIKTLERGYFEEEIAVNVYKYDKGMAVLKLDNEVNKAIESGTTIKMFP